jgi:hypothetical protein
MSTESKPDDLSDVPKLVFDKFLQALAGANAPPDVVGRLRKTLLDDKKFTERTLREAVLPEEQPR